MKVKGYERCGYRTNFLLIWYSTVGAFFILWRKKPYLDPENVGLVQKKLKRVLSEHFHEELHRKVAALHLGLHSVLRHLPGLQVTFLPQPDLFFLPWPLFRGPLFRRLISSRWHFQVRQELVITFFFSSIQVTSSLIISSILLLFILVLKHTNNLWNKQSSLLFDLSNLWNKQNSLCFDLSKQGSLHFDLYRFWNKQVGFASISKTKSRSKLRSAFVSISLPLLDKQLELCRCRPLTGSSRHASWCQIPPHQEAAAYLYLCREGFIFLPCNN